MTANHFKNGRQPQIISKLEEQLKLFQNCKITSYYFEIDKRPQIISKLEDDLKLFQIGRRPQTFLNLENSIKKTNHLFDVKF